MADRRADTNPKVSKLRPVETEIPAGPGDAGASDVPERLENEPRRHPGRASNGKTLVRLLVAVAIIFVITLLLWP